MSLNDIEEEIYVTNQMKSNGINNFHIGLTAMDYPGRFDWLDGSKSPYRNWGNGSVQKFTGKQLYVSVGLNGWFAQDHKNLAGFACKYTPGIRNNFVHYTTMTSFYHIRAKQSIALAVLHSNILV